MWLRQRFRLLMIVCRRRRGCSFGWALGEGGGEFFLRACWVAGLTLVEETKKRSLPTIYNRKTKDKTEKDGMFLRSGYR